MSSAITGAGGQKYRKLLVKQEGEATNTAITLYTATQDCLMYIWRFSSPGMPCIKINGTVTTSNYSVELGGEWVFLGDSPDEDIEHHVEMCGRGRAKLYLNTGDYVTLISSDKNLAKVNYRVLV